MCVNFVLCKEMISPFQNQIHFVSEIERKKLPSGESKTMFRRKTAREKHLKQ